MYSDDLKTKSYLNITCKISWQPLTVILGLEEFSKIFRKESVIRGFYSALNSVLIVGYKSNTQELCTSFANFGSKRLNNFKLINSNDENKTANIDFKRNYVKIVV